MISLIFAMDKNNLIGNGNNLPWHYKEDLEYFKQKTLNHKVVMGENTFYSIGKVLPNRCNVVATLSPDFKHEGVIVINDLIKYLNDNLDTDEEIFIIGGAQIYKLSLPYAKRIYITHIDREYKGDIYFPKINYEDYNVISSTRSGELNFVIYEKKCNKC